MNRANVQSTLRFHRSAIALSLMLTGWFPTITASTNDIKLGIILGFSGPIESLTPAMADAAELAFDEASASGLLLGGKTVSAIRGDSTCIDATAASLAAQKMIDEDGVAALVGADCSGAAAAILNERARQHQVTMISPSAVSPALAKLDDEGLFFRTVPTSVREASVLAQVLLEREIKSISILYIDNDYGRTLSSALDDAFVAGSGTTRKIQAYSEGKADYREDLDLLRQSGSDHLVIIGYAEASGKDILRAAIRADHVKQIVLAEGMLDEALISEFGQQLNGSLGVQAGDVSQPAQQFRQNISNEPLTAESYDAAALLVLAIQAAGSATRPAIQQRVLQVANAPGTRILSGELAKGLEILAQGGDIDYVGASNVEFTSEGESLGRYLEMEVSDGKLEVVRQR